VTGVIIFQADGTDYPETNALYDLFFRNYSNSITYAHESGSGLNHEYEFKNSQLNIDEWSHIIIVRKISKKTVDLYVNGDLIETYNYAENPDGGSLSTLKIAEHGGTVKVDRFFDGALDDIFIFNRALRASEIRYLNSCEDCL